MQSLMITLIKPAASGLGCCPRLEGASIGKDSTSMTGSWMACSTVASRLW